MREERPAACPVVGRIDPPVTVEQLLADARRGLARLTPAEAHAAMRCGALLVDIRGDAQRKRDGVIPGARFIPRNVLEWRCDPASPYRDPELGRSDARLMLICDEGYQSSLAAATLQRFGLRDATDVIGGFQVWRAEGLPVWAGSHVLPAGSVPGRNGLRPGPNAAAVPAVADAPARSRSLPADSD